MLAKALLTGSVLSVLAGSIVYFGAEGADATVRDSAVSERAKDVRVATEELALAGDANTAVTGAKTFKPVETVKTVVTEPVVEIEQGVETDSVVETKVADADVSEPPKKDAKPKTRWLDQYLKSTKPKSSDAKPSEMSDEMSKPDAKMKKQDAAATDHEISGRIEEGHGSSKAFKSKKKQVEGKLDKGADMGEMSEMREMEEERRLEKEAMKDVRRNRRADDSKGRIVRSENKKKRNNRVGLPLKSFDYGAVLDEAKKLQVIDMRDQAVLEIVDYAVDRGDIKEAKSVMDELSSPELRDTARARIGKGLATRGDMTAAFAVLDNIEIDELSAPIRLEIIAALMATREERTAGSRYR